MILEEKYIGQKWHNMSILRNSAALILKIKMSNEIENYMATLEPFQREIVNAVRETVLGADSKIKEGIKWGSIAFFNKKNICGFRIAKKHVTLLFMEGSRLKTPNILSGDGPKARTYQIANIADLNRKSIEALVQESVALGM